MASAIGKARRHCGEASANVDALQQRREDLAKRLEKVSKHSRTLTSRVATARDLVSRDQQQLVEAEARRLRAAGAQQWPGGRLPPGHTESSVLQAREAVEAARREQLRVLGRLQA